MLKAVFNIFQVTEAQVTPAAIARLKWASLAGLPALPLAATAKFGAFSGVLGGLILGLAILSVVGMFYTFTSRMANRLWIPERYLDEAEIARKRKSGSLVYQIMLLCLGFGAMVLSFFVTAAGDLPGISNPSIAAFITLGGFVTIPLCLQTFIAVGYISPLEQEPGRPPTFMDRYYKYGACVFLVALAALSYFAA